MSALASRTEFFRNLAVALRGMDHEIDGDHITVGGGNKKIDLKLSPLPLQMRVRFR